ncbi:MULTISPECIES: sterol desaturase family protein [unclassified Bradyrhizobium]|uniref:sterol desaturase family protein n=1 Tax=unclassified Bradyrhizobium TaxID=2631580 RepID=UPI001BA50B6E|nr:MULTISPECIES: sterol desaturase family protein [unclassified Bradyrhizobium]MBR1205529.1 sterol desaturase family protein [Bradyrhizobium sp. AUGA SZCCT0124]MBR1314022.1 sterol desaturase family protein [Bradyrhizobium sp. AUGA SZCCT0051]MBR1337856.1 sterol desaturase family protein [Bradyrhizobium sp. AUGA SZCCT0105]MBR1360097.1 sterol desaturase family protein [Bradyrhizobium sp. AUGA SZCCT0045]
MDELFGLSKFLLTLLIFVPIERLFAARPQKLFRRGLLTDMAFQFVNGWLIMVGVIVIVTMAILVNQSIVPSAVKQAIAGLPYLVQVLLVILIGDLGVYWTHRILHAVPAMWQIHAVHHAVEELDWLAAVHQHPLDVIFMKAGSLFPLFALGFSTEAIGTYFLVYYWQAYLAHANVRLNYGPLRYVLVSPEFHHWHHSSEKEARDKNFAGMISFYDWLFGSVYLPKGQRPKEFGVDNPMPSGYLALLAYPFREWSSSQRRDDPRSRASSSTDIVHPGQSELVSRARSRRTR